MSTLSVKARLARRAAATRFDLDVAFDTDAHAIVVLGPSGSGKTTLLQCMLGSLTPDDGRFAMAGDVLFDSASGIDLPIRRRRIGMVLQDALLFPHLDARENVAFAATGSADAGTWLERVGAQELAELRPQQLSGGQRQRVALARALAAEPSLLLLDEPFSSLDRGGRYELGSVLLDLHRQTGTPFVLVTHDVGEAVRLGTELVILQGGSVVDSGPPQRLIAPPRALPASQVLGDDNIFRARVVAHHLDAGYSEVELDGGTRVFTSLLALETDQSLVLALRAEDPLISLERTTGTSARNVLAGSVAAVEPGDRGALVTVSTPTPVSVRVTAASVRELGLRPGRAVHLLIKATAFARLDG